ncbi:ATP-binding protein [Candidatus Poribacteria bacterium]
MVLEKFLAQLFEAKDILYATIYEETGLILTQKSIIEETPSRELIKEIVRKAEIRRLNVDINGRTKILDIRVPVYYETDIIGCIQIGLSFARIDAEIRKRIINLSLFVIGFVLLGLVASFAFARTLTTPIKDLLQGVKRIGAGDLSHVVKMKRSDEIGELAVAVNDMSNELLRKTTSIENLNQEIMERKKAEEALASRARRQAEMAGFGQFALAGNSLDDLFDQAVSMISRTLGTKYAKVLEYRPEQGVLFLRAGVGWKEGWVGHKSVPDGSGSQGGYTLLQDKPVIAEDIHNEARFSPPALLAEHNTVSGMTVAIPGADRPFGVLGVHTDRMQRFSDDDAHFLEAVANVLAAAIQRKQAEVELETERKQLLSMFDGMDEVIYVFDPGTYEILYMNGPARKQWGNGIGQKCYHVLQGNDSPCSFCNNKHLPSENPYIREIQNNINDRWYRTYYKAIRWSDGRVVRFGLAVDITEQRQTEEELQKVQRLESIGALAGGIAHDLNNLLTIILTNIAVARIYDAPSDKDKSMAEAERASMQMKNLAQQLLTFSKGGAPIRKLTDIGNDLQRSVSFALGGSNVKCEFSIPDGLWAAEVDGGQLDQVINNMVINANQAMPDGGIINVYAENMTVNEEHGLPLEPGNYIKISFADQGVGIPANLLPRIFDPFFSTKQQGNGLGLATSYSIIKKHDGYITVESEIDVGTVFHIYIPASLEGILVQKEEKNQGPATGDGRILIMDDEAALREAMTRIGTFLGYRVVGAADGIEALEQYKSAMKSDPFDLVIMDLTIPGSMGGKEAIQKLREMDPNAKAIVSSGYSNDPVMADFKKYGFSGVIAKPYKMQELSIELNRVITEAA